MAPEEEDQERLAEQEVNDVVLSGVSMLREAGMATLGSGVGVDVGVGVGDGVGVAVGV